MPSIASTAYYSFQFLKAAVEKAQSYDHDALFNGFKGVAAMTMLSEQPLTIDGSNMTVNYPMYLCQVQPGGAWHIVEDPEITPSHLKC